MPNPPPSRAAARAVLAVLLLAGSLPAAETVSLSSLDLSLAKQGWSTPKADRSVEGKPMIINGRRFEHGFGTHAVSNLVLDLKGGCSRFTAQVGVDDEQNGTGTVEFVLFADDQVVWRSGVMGSGEGPLALDVPLTGVKQLVLHVTDGGDGTGNDHADWADAKLVVSGEKPVSVAIPAGKVFSVPPPPLSAKTYMSKTPAGYTATIFAKPPEVSYPVCVSASGDGVVFVSVDKNGSLDKSPHRGQIVRLVDSTGAGVADQAGAFVADVDSPRGIYYDGDTLYCLHPPTLTAYRDTKGVGVADSAVDIVTGVGYGLDKRPADHTSNGIRIAIDGWIYMAIGDFGIPAGKGSDGASLVMRGGGVVRVRPDGSELEVYAHHTRNILDVSQDPYLNGFIYDNTNDGDGWNSRFTYFVGLADIGYPSLYLRFANQLLPTLADFGGGAAVGALYLHEPGLPGADGDAQFICDWGTSHIYRIPLKADGAGFQQVERLDWARVDRVTDMDVDGNSRIYVSSWKGAVFTNAGPNVGAVICLQPVGTERARFPDLRHQGDAALVQGLASRSAVCRQQAQHEILRRGPRPAFAGGLDELMKPANPLYVRIAALFTRAQLYGPAAHPALLAAAKDPTIEEWALRALADRKSQLAGVPSEPFLAGLGSADPRVRVQALIGLARLGKRENARAIVPLAAVKPEWKDAQLIIPHTAVRALVELGDAEPVLAAVSPGAAPELVDGALWALKWMHDARSVEGLVSRLEGAPPELKRKLYDTLAHLYYTEGEWNREAWWTTRPEHQGPYFQRATWAGTPMIEAALRAALKAGGEAAEVVKERIAFYQLKIDGAVAAVPLKAQPQADAELLAKARAAAAKFEGKVIGNIPYEDVLAVAQAAKGEAKQGEMLFTRQGCVACHTVSKEVAPKGPFLGEIARQYSRADLIESIVKPNAKIAQGFATRWFTLKDGSTAVGFIISEGAETITLCGGGGVVSEIQTDQIVSRGEQKNSMMPEGLVANLTPEELSSLLAYFEALAAGK
jgi:putative heme-binding domain-containing protein